jgi:hypothetical protein
LKGPRALYYPPERSRLMKGLDTNGLRELNLLRRRVVRLWGMGRISHAAHVDLLKQLDIVQQKMDLAEGLTKETDSESESASEGT